ncbi:MAG: PEP-CTERM sorting domain-containing protein [Armatimonadetes bacterium]|nr:PEP-CTERM sorting domain-containing protein [Armatimonadota bacterium]
MKLRVLGAIALLGTAALSQAFVMNFDQDSSGNNIADGTTLSNQYAGYGCLWQSSLLDPNSGWASVTDMTMTSTDVGAGYDASMGNILHSFGGWLGEDGDPNMGFTYDGSLGAISSVSCVVMGDTSASSLMAAYHDNGSSYDLLGVAYATGTSGAPETLTLNGFSQTVDLVLIAPGYYFDWAGVDDVKVETVPEPATMAVLGLGALAALKRRKK